jgi:hypothetical protein
MERAYAVNMQGFHPLVRGRGHRSAMSCRTRAGAAFA